MPKHGKLHPMSSVSTLFSGLARGLTLLAIGLWVGGMAFFGAVAAPLMFRMARQSTAPELAPLLVGAMLGRFTWITYACAGAMLLGWLIDGWLTRDRRWLWWAQGALTTVCLGLALYLGTVTLPRTVADQSTIVPLFAKDARGQKLTPAEQSARAAFDVGHTQYQKLGALSVYLLLGVLGIVVARTRVAGSARGSGIAQTADSATKVAALR